MKELTIASAISLNDLRPKFGSRVNPALPNLIKSDINRISLFLNTFKDLTVKSNLMIEEKRNKKAFFPKIKDQCHQI